MATLRDLRIPALLAAALVLIAAFAVLLARDDEEPRPAAKVTRTFASDDPIERGCLLEDELLARIARGWDPEHSEDITYVPLAPNTSGTFDFLSHTGPWDYVQRVPLVLYGPEHVRPAGSVEREVTLADIFPTIGELVGVDLPARDGTVLDEALTSVARPPRLVVTVVWDGAGANVLERWPDAWPHLARLMEEGTSYTRATVGSSPSITPSVHSTLGTGAFPDRHGVTAIQYRDASGRVRSSFAGSDPRDLKLATFADIVDKALDNEPLAGLVAWQNWHLGMLGHGRANRGGDADHLALITEDGGTRGNRDYFETPEDLIGQGALERHISALDREDGAVDGQWMGHAIADEHNNPAWAAFQHDLEMRLLGREGYGEDRVPDFLFSNYKMTDLVGHVHTMDSPEMEAVLRAQDEALGALVRRLEREIEDFVVIVTADHGSTPSPSRSGGWPIDPAEVVRDIDARFGSSGTSLVEQTHATGLFLDDEALAESGIQAVDIARFLNAYTLGDSLDDELPAPFRDRGQENAYAAAWPQEDLARILECAGVTRG